MTQFAERARHADPHFALTEGNAQTVARLVRRLDGLPLAVELAAARVDVPGVVQLLDRLDDRFGWLAGGDRLAADRQRSLAATVEWSYQLLTEEDQRVFRHLSVFPAAFTLEAAEAVAGPGAGPVVLRLVDCSLLAPPQLGPASQARYRMLETLRAYGAGLAAEAGEQAEAAASLTRYAAGVAGEASAAMGSSSGELAAVRLLDAEDATMRQALAWARDHDRDTASQLAVALAPWWVLRGRWAGEHPLREAATHAAPGSDTWCAAHFWVGQFSLLAGDLAGALSHYTEVRDTLAGRPPCRVLADCLASRSAALANMGRIPEAIAESRLSLKMSRKLGYPAGEALALANLAIPASYAGDLDGAVQLAGEAGRIRGDMPGWIARVLTYILAAVQIDAGDLAAAERTCTMALASSREVGDLLNQAALLIQLAVVSQQTGRTSESAACLVEGLQTALRTGSGFELLNGLDCCAHLCAVTGRPADAVTMWAAHAALMQQQGSDAAPDSRRREEPLRQARGVLGDSRARAVQARGAAMSMSTAAEYGIVLATPAKEQPGQSAAAGKLSARERELSAWWPEAAPTRRSPPSFISACARSALIWTGSGIRRAAGAALT